jgi:uncharacterized membrane protein
MAYSAIQPAPTDIARQSSEPVVQVILFWEQECPKCEQLLEGFLPAFQLAHGEQFSIEMIEVVSVDDINRLFQIGAAYGLSKNQVGVPLMIVGDYALVGATQIPAELPALVEAYLASGGVLTRLRELPQEGVAIAEEVKDDGMWLAWLTMAVMAAGLLLAGWQIWRAFDGEAVFRLPPWTGWLTPVLVVLGIGVAVYLTFIETTKVQAICGPVGDCNAVQNSKYAMLFGLIPVGVLGLLGYLGILAFWFAQRLRMGILAEYAPVIILGLTVFGTAFSVYLTYLEIFVIDAVCIWCISSAWIMTGLMVLSLPAAVSWLAGAEEDAA